MRFKSGETSGELLDSNISECCLGVASEVVCVLEGVLGVLNVSTFGYDEDSKMPETKSPKNLPL